MTLTLEASKKIYEIVGEYETEKSWLKCNGEMDTTYGYGWFVTSTEYARSCHGMPNYPAPSFSELIRLLPLIGEKKGWPKNQQIEGKSVKKITYRIVRSYQQLPLEKAMEIISQYLLKIL